MLQLTYITPKLMDRNVGALLGLSASVYTLTFAYSSARFLGIHVQRGYDPMQITTEEGHMLSRSQPSDFGWIVHYWRDRKRFVAALSWIYVVENVSGLHGKGS